MDKQNTVYIYTRYYSALKRNEVLTHAATWMNLENNMLSERSQTQKATYCMLALIYVQNGQGDRKQISGCKVLWGKVLWGKETANGQVLHGIRKVLWN